MENKIENKDKIILDLCGGTGSWSRPYKEAGYDVRLITLPDYDVLTYEPPDNVYGILAAPPCTEFSLRKCMYGRFNFEKGMITVKACLDIIWNCRYKNKLKFWAMENPVGFLRQFLGIPCFTFYQWQFGDLGIKRTDIWGYFKKPIPTVKVKPANCMYMGKDRMRKKRYIIVAKECKPDWYKGKLDIHGIRAITPERFARAFYMANK